jgi:saccharopine dehydrogenase-like NADP-dependent oxidoreductase
MLGAMKRAVVLGGGMIGTTIAADLAASDGIEVTVVDARADALERIAAACQVQTVEADLSNPAEITRVVAGFDVAVGALPSAFGLAPLRAMIEAGTSCVDISFMADDPFELDELARERGVAAVVDCGVSPGISNVLLGFGVSELDTAERIVIHVAGLPVERRWPFQYQAPFAPFDVIEEYTRDARIVINGEVVTRPALSEPELLDFPGIGTLEAFNTDGLRTLIRTMDAPDMLEKTMRYPGHIELMRVFRETGLFSEQAIEVDGAKVVPRDVTSALLFPKWQFADGEADLTVLQVVLDGVRGGARVRYRWRMIDYYDPETGTRSMSRTTGYPAAIVAAAIARGELPVGPGVHPPEHLGREPGFADRFVSELELRGVHVDTFIEAPE